MECKEKDILSAIDMSLGHFIITQVSFEKLMDLDDSEIISGLLKTKYFIWNYKLNPNGQTIELDDENGNNRHFQNEKFFGFYKTEELDFTDFREINVLTFKSSLEDQILNKTNSDFLNKCLKLISKLSIEDSTFYSIQPPESKIPEIVKA